MSSYTRKENDKFMEIEWKKIKRVAIGEASERERQEVEAWIRNDAERGRFLERMTFYYEGGQNNDELSLEDIDRGWKNVRPKKLGSTIVYRKRIIVWASSVAVLVGLFCGSLFIMDSGELKVIESKKSGTVQLILSDGTKHEISTGEHIMLNVPGFRLDEQGMLKQVGVQPKMTEEKEIKYNKVVVPRCGEYQLSLADGTRVVLNSESSIRFPDSFDDKERKVYLSGEGYFEVTHDADKPFLVEAGGVEIQVLGTWFNVRAYEGSHVFTTLVSGRVQVGSFSDSLILSPGQQCEVDGDSGQLIVKDADIVSVLAWKNGEFVFKDIALERVMEEFARWYDMQIMYETEELKGIRLYIYVERSKTLEEVLDKVALIGEFKYEINGKKVVIQR